MGLLSIVCAGLATMSMTVHVVSAQKAQVSEIRDLKGSVHSLDDVRLKGRVPSMWT